ncbi:Transcriptional repressor, CopY family (fragment) [Candidatus Zixiibacteriota bacterium]
MESSEKPAVIYHPSRPGLEKFWGKLEAELLEIIWSNGPMTVKRALFFIRKKRLYAYTTIMTMMNHLVNKGILRREKQGHSFMYYPTVSKDEFLRSAADEIISGLLADFPEIAEPLISDRSKRLKRRK